MVLSHNICEGSYNETIKNNSFDVANKPRDMFHVQVQS